MSSQESFLNLQTAVKLIKHTGYQCWIRAYSPLFWIVSFFLIYWRDTQHYLSAQYNQSPCRIPNTQRRRKLHVDCHTNHKRSRHSKSTQKRSEDSDDMACSMEHHKKERKRMRTVTFHYTQSNAKTLQGHQQCTHVVPKPKVQDVHAGFGHPKAILLKVKKTYIGASPTSTITTTTTTTTATSATSATRQKSLTSLKLPKAQWKWKKKVCQQSTDAIAIIPPPPSAAQAEPRRRSSLLFLKRRLSQNSTTSDSSMDSNTSSSASSNDSKKDRVKRFFASVKTKQRRSSLS